MPEVPFFATGSQLGVVATIDNSEIVEVTAITGDVLTVTRERRGTALQPLGDGWILGNGIYTQDLDAIMSYVDAAVATAKQEAKEEAHPVGTLYYNADVATNPAALLGFGTWSAYAAGRVPVGKAASGTFGTAGANVGGETHRHKGYGDGDGLGDGDLRATIGSASGQANTINFQALDPINPNTGSGLGNGTYSVQGNNQGTQGFAHYTKVVGYTSTNSSIQPSIVVYIWRRTA